jgi:hypothetical protein
MMFMHALLWFEQRWIVPVLAVFVLLLATTFWPSRKHSVERHGSIPLEPYRIFRRLFCLRHAAMTRPSVCA